MDYIYKINVTRVIDGDTIDADIELGFDMILSKRIRLHGIDAPETRTRDKEEKVKGFATKARLEEIVEQNNKVLYLHSIDKGKYGRCVGDLFEVDFEHESINDMLINEGLAEPYRQ